MRPSDNRVIPAGPWHSQTREARDTRSKTQDHTECSKPNNEMVLMQSSLSAWFHLTPLTGSPPLITPRCSPPTSTPPQREIIHSMPPVLGYPIPAKMIRNHNQETHTGRIQHTALGTCRNATPRTPRHQGEAHHQIPRVCRQMLNGQTEAHIKRIPTRDNCMRTHANRDPQSLFSGRVHQDIRRQGIGSVQIQGRNALAIHPQTGPAITLVIRSLVVVFQWIHPEPHSSRCAHGTKKCRVGLPTCDPSVRPIRLSGAGTVHPRGGAPPGKPPGRYWFWFHSATPART